jgi:glucosamine--fructose-6-phosphate aminotransferase (isomerizing)
MTKGRMLDYIREQPESVANTRRVCRPGIAELQQIWAGMPPKHVIVAGLGSSYTAAQMASPLLRRCLPVPTSVTVATEVGVDLGLPLGPDTLVVLVSRSGERGGIVDAQLAARRAGATCVAVTAVESSLLGQGADVVIVTGEGPESTYAKTKSVIATATALMELGLAFGADAEEMSRLEAALARVPAILTREIEEAEHHLEPLASRLARHQSALITGTAGNQGVAQEGAIKIQEAAALTCEWDEAGSAYYGTVTILNPGWLFVALVTRADYQLSRALLDLAGQFGAYRLCIAEPGLELDGNAEAVVRVGEAGDPLLAPLLFLPPIHLLTYHLAAGRGLNPDEPLFADMMLKAMLPPGREEPDWRPATVREVPDGG